MPKIAKMIQNNIQSSKVQSKEVKTENKPIEKKESMSTTAKAMIGASALAVIVAGGLLCRKGLNAKALNNEIKVFKDSILKRVEMQEKDPGLKEVFDPAILRGHVDELSKLPKQQQLSRIKEMNSALANDRGLELGLTIENSFLTIDRTKLPKEVQEAIVSKDQLRATEEYIKYCDNLFFESKTKGKTIAESVENVFGKGTSIQPHTYDLSKEADRIATAQYGAGGYNDITVMSNNTIAARKNHKHTVGLYTRIPAPASTQNAIVGSGMRDGKPVVTISYRAGNRDDALNCIELLSPNAEMTPAQLDLLKLKDNAGALDVSDLSKATMPTDSVYGQTNFDAILSAIQTLASKVAK